MMIDLKTEKLAAALARYAAMAGWIKDKDMPPLVARRARADGRRYGEIYLPKRGKRIAQPLQMMRFMVNVCGLSLKEAAWAMRLDFENMETAWGWVPQCAEAEVAEKVHKATGDIFDSIALARFYAWIVLEPDYWTGVRDHLIAMTVTEEDTGIENWQEPVKAG